MPLGDKAAGRIARFAVAIAAIIAAGKTLEALNQAIVAALPLTVLARGVFALAAALTLAELLRRFAATTSDEEASLGPYIPTEAEAGAGPPRIVGWTAVADGDRERARRLRRLRVVPGRSTRLDQRSPRAAAARHRARRRVHRRHAARANPDRDGAPGQHGPAPALAGADRRARHRHRPRAS